MKPVSEVVCAAMGHDFTMLRKSEDGGTEWRCVRCGLMETSASARTRAARGQAPTGAASEDESFPFGRIGLRRTTNSVRDSRHER